MLFPPPPAWRSLHCLALTRCQGRSAYAGHRADGGRTILGYHHPYDDQLRSDSSAIKPCFYFCAAYMSANMMQQLVIAGLFGFSPYLPAEDVLLGLSLFLPRKIAPLTFSKSRRLISATMENGIASKSYETICLSLLISSLYLLMKSLQSQYEVAS